MVKKRHNIRQTMSPRKVTVFLAFGDEIRACRANHGYKASDVVNELAKEGVKIHTSYVSLMELYGVIPSKKVIIGLANIFGQNPDKFLKIAHFVKAAQTDERLATKYDIIA